MKWFLLIFLICLSITAFSEINLNVGGLKPEEQSFFKNDSMQGKNHLERIDSNVREINKIYGELTALKAEVAVLKKEVEKLKNHSDK